MKGTKISKIIALWFAGLAILTGTAGGILPVTQHTTWTDLSPLADYDGVEISSGVTLTLNLAAAATLTKPISGTGNVVKNGAGALSIEVASPSFDGPFYVRAGVVKVYNDAAFGSTAGKTIVESTNPYIEFHDVTMAEAFDLNGTADTVKLSVPAGKTATLNGAVTVIANASQISVGNGAKLVFNAGLNSNPESRTVKLSADQNGEIHFNNSPCLSPLNNQINNAGKIYFNVPGNAGGYNANWLTCGVDWAFDGVDLKLGALYYANPNLDLAGHPQRVTRISAFNATRTTYSYVKSADKAFLYVNDSTDGETVARTLFQGKAGLCWEGSGTVVLTNVMTSTGDILVQNGCVKFADKSVSSWAGAGVVTVSGEGRMELVDATQIGSPDLVLADNGVLKLPANSRLVVNTLKVDGVAKAEGVYAASALNNHLDGTGAEIQVLFDANALYIDQNTTWDDAGIAILANYNGVILKNGAVLTLNLSRDYELVKPIGGDGSIVKDGAGNLSIKAANSFNGQFTIRGSGDVHAYNDASFGTVAGCTRLETGSGASLVLHDGLVTAEPIDTIGGGGGTTAYGEISVPDSESVTLNGEIRILQYGQEIVVGERATLVCNGGLVAPNAAHTAHISVKHLGQVQFNDKPCAAQLFNQTDSAGKIYFNVTGNAGGYNANWLTCGVDWAFDGVDLKLGANYYANPNLDLAGHPQRVTSISAFNATRTTYSNVKSVDKAFLYVNDSTAGETVARTLFQEKAGLYWEGTGTVVLTNVMTSTGDITVANGCVKFVDTSVSSWKNAGAVTVCGAGRLEISDAETFGTDTEVRIDGSDARINLGDGVVQTVGEVFIDGKRGYRRGTYGGLESSAQFKDSRFIGRGVLKATKGNPQGLFLVVQ
ncbi:MAG: autotransporter-associated beta strand repeat-containing protein [bacterium]|nr:autotransporter-associated beta strand repeat-containing protein [Candidatus Colisoma equi]